MDTSFRVAGSCMPSLGTNLPATLAYGGVLKAMLWVVHGRFLHTGTIFFISVATISFPVHFFVDELSKLVSLGKMSNSVYFWFLKHVLSLYVSTVRKHCFCFDGKFWLLDFFGGFAFSCARKYQNNQIPINILQSEFDDFSLSLNFSSSLTNE